MKPPQMRNPGPLNRIFPAIFLAALLLGLFAGRAARADTLDATRARGVVVCGVNIGLAGFGLPDDRGVWRGFDIDYCRAVAAAIFDDPDKVKLYPAVVERPFHRPAIGRSGPSVAQHHLDQVRAKSGRGCCSPQSIFTTARVFWSARALGIASALKLDGASVCVQQGTTNELNLADFFRAHGLKMEPVVFATADEAIKAYDSGRCDAYTTDASGALRRTAETDPSGRSCRAQGNHFQRTVFARRCARATTAGSIW